MLFYCIGLVWSVGTGLSFCLGLVFTYMAWSFQSPLWGRIDILWAEGRWDGVLRSRVFFFFFYPLYWVVV